MTIPNDQDHAPSTDISSRFSNLRVDNPFQSVPAPAAVHDGAGQLPPRPFSHAEQIAAYDYYNTSGLSLTGGLDTPFSPGLPALSPLPLPYGYGMPHYGAGDLASARQHQFEYGQADPYANPGLGLGLGVGLRGGVGGHPPGLDHVSRDIAHVGGYLTPDSTAQRRGRGTQGMQRASDPRTPTGQGGPKQQQQQQQLKLHQAEGNWRDGPRRGGQSGGRQSGKKGMGEQAGLGQGLSQGFGGNQWPVNNGVFVERGKKGQFGNHRSVPHTPLQNHHAPYNAYAAAAHTTHTPTFGNDTPTHGIARNALGQYTPNTPSYQPNSSAQYGLQHAHYPAPGMHTPYSPMRYQGGRPRRFDDNPRSALLEDFRLNKEARHWDISQIFGHIIEFSGDQHGSRLIQSKLELASPHDKQAMYEEILPNAQVLMTDVFGNYVVQKFFECGTDEQARGLAKKMEGNVLALTMQMYGCRVVQKALDRVDEEQKLKFIAELQGRIVQCVTSSNANHVIQASRSSPFTTYRRAEKIIQSDPPKSVVDAFLGHAYELSIHSYGCRVLQKAVEYLPDEHKRDLLEELHEHAQYLIEDIYGNYVIQGIITSAGAEHCKRIVKVIQGQVWAFSRHKFASNVVEKAILHADANDKRELVSELVNLREDGTHRIGHVIKDQFANFVFQTCLKAADHAQRQQLLDLVVPIIGTVRHTPPGKRIDGIINDMMREGFTVSSLPPTSAAFHPSAGAATGANRLALPPGLVASGGPKAAGPASLALHKTVSNPASDCATETTDSIDMSRSGSSSTHITSPEGLAPGRNLRPTASAPPRPDQASVLASACQEPQLNGRPKSKLNKGKGKAIGAESGKVNGAEDEALIELLQ